MKKAVLVLVLTLMTGAVYSQTQFSVPSVEDSTKYQRMVSQANSLLLVEISHAKDLGQTVEEAAKYVGDLFKTTWNQEEGFEGFVNGSLYNFYCFTPYGQMKILEQSDDHIIFEVTNFNSWLKKNGPVFNVTYEEYVAFMEIIHERIADYLNSSASIEENEGGLVVTIRKKTT